MYFSNLCKCFENFENSQKKYDYCYQKTQKQGEQYVAELKQIMRQEKERFYSCYSEGLESKKTKNLSANKLLSYCKEQYKNNSDKRLKKMYHHKLKRFEEYKNL